MRYRRGSFKNIKLKETQILTKSVLDKQEKMEKNINSKFFLRRSTHASQRKTK